MSVLESAVLASNQYSASGIKDQDILKAISSDALALGDDIFISDKVRHLVYLLTEQVRRLEAKVRELEQRS